MSDELNFELEEIQHKAQLEAAQRTEYLRVFRPSPEPLVYIPFDPTPYGFMATMGIAAFGFIMSAIGGAIFAAIRTLGVFAQAESSLLTKFGWNSILTNATALVAGFCLVAAVEGLLVSYGYNVGVKTGRLNASYVPVIIAAAISAFAGLIPSFELLEENTTKDRVVNLILWLLVLVSGPGISVLVYYSSENLGYLHNSWIEIVRGKQAEHDKAFAEQNAERIREIKQWEHEFEDDYRLKGRSVLYGQDTFTVKRGSKAPVHAMEEDKGVQDAVAEYLERQVWSANDVGLGEGKLISPKELANIIGRDPARVRTALNRLRHLGK